MRSLNWTICVLLLMPVAMDRIPLEHDASAQVTSTVRYVDDLIRALSKARGGLRNPSRADEVMDVLRATAKQGEDISPEVAELIRRNIDSIPPAVIDPWLIRFLSSNPAICDGAWELAMKAGVRNSGPRIAQLAADLGEGAGPMLSKLASTLSARDSAMLLRGLSGRMLSRNQVISIVDGLQLLADTRTKGEVFEAVTRAQLSRGALKAGSGLKEGGEVIVGKYDSIRGIDGIGVGPNGRPVIFEISMDRMKALSPDESGLTQLSPAWTADRWNKMMQALPADRRADLKRIGVDDEWLRTVTPDEARTWTRKLVAAHESALTDANRLAAELGSDDLLLLGGR